MLRPRLKTILLSITIVVTLSIIGLAWAVWKLDRDMTEKMQQKQFLRPTEYYAFPQTFKKDTRWKVEEIEKEFQKNNYRSRAANQVLLPGDFFVGDPAACDDRAKPDIPSDTKHCIIFVKKAAPEGQLNWLFVSEDQIIELWSHEGRVPELQLEPMLMAQYLENQPLIQKNYELSEIPVQCMNAVLAIEDQNFLEHGGFSYTSFARAIVKNVIAGRSAQGGSTITQQLVKNYFLSSERTLKRKFQELIMAILLESRFTKDQILETYLNIIYMGQNGAFRVHGFPAAYEYYFQKELKDASIGECAMLAAILNSPGLFNPWRKPENAMKRQQLVLSKMKELNYISERDYVETLSNPPRAAPPKAQAQETAPYYIDAVQKFLVRNGLPHEGVRIFTAIDLQAQHKAQEALNRHLENLEKNNELISQNKEKGLSLEGAVLSGDARSGLVHVLVGGRNFRKTQFNRAVDGHRQVGSIMKPFVYLKALMSEDKEGNLYRPTSLVADESFEIKYQNQTWKPENYDKKFYGEVPLFFSLKNSLNAATARLAFDVGLDGIVDVAHQMGIESDLQALPSLALGAFEIYPIEVLRAYMSLSQMGARPELGYVLRVESLEGDILYEFESQAEPFEDPAAVASLVSMMKQTVLSGTARYATLTGFQHPAAGKTGTTSDYRDTWFAGFTPDFTTVVWVGYDHNEKTGLTGASGTVPVWTDVMKYLVERTPMKDFDWPDDTQTFDISPDELKKLNAVRNDEDASKIELVFKR